MVRCIRSSKFAKIAVAQPRSRLSNAIFFRSAASGKMGVELFSKLECSELRFCFIGNEINTGGARHPMAFCPAFSPDFFARRPAGK